MTPVSQTCFVTFVNKNQAFTARECVLWIVIEDPQSTSFYDAVIELEIVGSPSHSHIQRRVMDIQQEKDNCHMNTVPSNIAILTVSHAIQIYGVLEFRPGGGDLKFYTVASCLTVCGANPIVLSVPKKIEFYNSILCC